MDIDRLFHAAGAADWGQAAYDDLKACMTGAAQGRAADLLGAEPAGVFVAAFPYYADEAGGNLSQYARGRDYHVAITRRLKGPYWVNMISPPLAWQIRSSSVLQARCVKVIPALENTSSS